jgi:hypothetical protein
MTRLLFLLIALAIPSFVIADDLDLSRAVVATRGDKASLVEQTAATVLIEEVEKRTGNAWQKTEDIDELTPAIVITKSLEGKAVAKAEIPETLRERASALKPEGFCIYIEHPPARTMALDTSCESSP